MNQYNLSIELSITFHSCLLSHLPTQKQANIFHYFHYGNAAAITNCSLEDLPTRFFFFIFFVNNQYCSIYQMNEMINIIFSTKVNGKQTGVRIHLCQNNVNLRGLRQAFKFGGADKSLRCFQSQTPSGLPTLLCQLWSNSLPDSSHDFLYW